MKLQLKYSNQLCINSKKHTQTVKMWTKKKWKYQITNRNLNNNKHEQKCEQSAKFNWIWKFFKGKSKCGNAPTHNQEEYAKDKLQSHWMN